MGPLTAGLVLHGAGGIGKSALAAEIIARVGRLEPARMSCVLCGEVSADTVLAGLAAALRQHPMVAAWGGTPAEAVEAADRIDLPWAHRLALLREHVLGHVPVLLGLDNFDDNLAAESGSWTVRDPALAGLLASWSSTPHQGRLLITCRHPFILPGGAVQALGFRRLGPLSSSDAAAFAMSLPALRLLGAPQLDRMWRLLGGHPRAMEYLDALLSAGHGRFPDVAGGLAGAVRASTGQPVLCAGPDPAAELSPAGAEAVAQAAGDFLLSELCRNLSTGAQDLLIGASVYRAAVGCHALLLPADPHGQPDGLASLVAECEAMGLVATDRSCEPPSVFVHRWTACELHRRLVEAQRSGEVAEAHRRAASYWRERATTWPHDGQALREAAYHLAQAGVLAGQDEPAARRTVTVRRRLRVFGLATAAVTVSAFLAAEASGVFPHRSLAVSVPPTSAGAAASQSAAVRGQAAAWAAQQVSADAIVACDPAMCSALQAHGIAPGNLLMLRPSAPDPLGADLVMATAAVRSQFGARLASVYAPEVVASFGSGRLRIDVRAVAPDGAAAYRFALVRDLAARRAAGSQLVRNAGISIPAAARHELGTGQVDPRLLVTLAAVAAAEPVRIVAFAGSGPGASAGMPLRAVELSARAGAAAPGTVVRKILAFVRAQRPPYLPASAVIVGGGPASPVLRIAFGAPSPVGLLQAPRALR